MRVRVGVRPSPALVTRAAPRAPRVPGPPRRACTPPAACVCLVRVQARVRVEQARVRVEVRVGVALGSGSGLGLGLGSVVRVSGQWSGSGSGYGSLCAPSVPRRAASLSPGVRSSPSTAHTTSPWRSPAFSAAPVGTAVGRLAVVRVGVVRVGVVRTDVVRTRAHRRRLRGKHRPPRFGQD